MSHTMDEIAFLAAEARARIVRSMGAKPIEALLHIPQPDWLLPGFLQKKSIHILSSESGSGKTWLALQMALAGASNTEFLGVHPAHRFDTIYLGADSPDWDIANQIRQLQRATGVSFPEDSDTVILPYGLNLRRDDHVEIVLNYLNTTNCALLVLDVLLYTYLDAEENSNSDMAKVFHSLKYLRDNSDCAILALHHWKKGTEEARGAGTIVQAAEHTFILRKEEDGVLLKRGKIRGEGDWPHLNIKLAPRNGGLCFLQSTPEPSILMAWFALKPIHTRDELVRMANLNNKSAAWLGAALTNHRKSGKLFTDGRGRWATSKEVLA